MASDRQPFSGFKRVLRTFFKHDLVLRREDARLRLGLEDRTEGAPPRPLGRAELAARREREELACVAADLAALLDEDPTMRGAMRQLAFVEEALAERGWAALDKVPLDLLARAHAQLEGLVMNWSPVGLALLRSKMAVAVAERESGERPAEMGATALAFADAAAADAAAAEPVVEATQAGAVDDAAALFAAYAALGVESPAPGGAEQALDLEI